MWHEESRCPKCGNADAAKLCLDTEELYDPSAKIVRARWKGKKSTGKTKCFACQSVFAA